MSQVEVHQSKKRLFYIYTGGWRDNAAGIKVMHLLCHALNKVGEEAFLVIGNHKRGIVQVNPKLNTPILDRGLSILHFRQGKTPRVIYSETIIGNPLRASCVVRYFLNYPGVLGGNLSFPNTEMQVAYTQNIKKHLPSVSTVLFLPAVDLDELPKGKILKEDYHLFYAGKYKAFVGNPDLPPNLKMKEVTRHGSEGTTRNDILVLLAKAKSIFLFENSTLATEAILMGTPVVFMDNPFLGAVIAEQELGIEGTIKGYSEEGLLAAIASIDIAKEKFLRAQNDFWLQLVEFISDSDVFFQNTSTLTHKKIHIPQGMLSSSRHKVRLFIGVMRNYGLFRALKASMILSIKLTKNKK
jgi:hypothetical protein